MGKKLRGWITYLDFPPNPKPIVRHICKDLFHSRWNFLRRKFVLVQRENWFHTGHFPSCILLARLHQFLPSFRFRRFERILYTVDILNQFLKKNYLSVFKFHNMVIWHFISQRQWKFYCFIWNFVVVIKFFFNWWLKLTI